MSDSALRYAMNCVDLVVKGWPIVAVVLLAVVVLLRTRSFFFFYHRAFQLIGAGKVFSNHDDQKAWDEYLSLMSFNLQLGFGLTSVKNKREFHQWRKKYGFEIAELRMAGWYFRANAKAFDVVAGWWRVCRASIVIVVVSFLSFWSVIFSNAESALWQAKGGDSWFWVNTDTAKDFYYELSWDVGYLKSRRWKLESTDCRYATDAGHGLGTWVKGVACLPIVGLYQDEVVKTVASQKRFGGFLLVLTILTVFWLLVLEIWTLQAMRLCDRVFKGAESVRDALD